MKTMNNRGAIIEPWGTPYRIWPISEETLLGADHFIPGGGRWFFCEKKIVQQILENK